MSFTNLFFIGRFLPVFLIIYLIVPRKYKDFILFIGSMLFYAYGEHKIVILLLVLVFVNYFLGKFLVASRGITEESLPTVESVTQSLIPRKKTLSDSISRKTALIFAVSLDAGVLILFKVLAKTSTGIGLPLGLSFYIFKMISYQADLYNGKIKTMPTFVRAAAYFTMFPQIAEGPIMRYGQGDFDKTHGRIFSWQKFEGGMVRIVIGLSMKVLLADRIGILWNETLKMGYENISTPLAWMSAFAYTFQLYFDFWGYSLMASGLGMMLGFEDIINFEHPYAAKNIADFYRRWHATLGSWFRDYIYFPLGGSRKSTLVTIRNLMIVWIITGLWHGGDINFLIWGTVLGIMIIIEKFVSKNLLKKVPIIGRLHVWILIPLTWVIFAISDLHSLAVYFCRLFPFFGIGHTVLANDFMDYLPTYLPYFIASVVLCVPAVYDKIISNRKHPVVIVALFILFWVSLYYALGAQGNAFMYFSF